MATLGYTTVGVNGDTWGNGEMPVWGPYTMTENGTLTEGRVVNSVSGSVFKVVIYNDNGSNAPGTLFAYFADYTTSGVDGGFRAIATAITGGTALISGNKYHIGIDVISGTTPNTNYDTGILSPGGESRKGSVPATPPDPYGTPGGSTAGQAGSAHIIYTPGGGGAAEATYLGARQLFSGRSSFGG